jgi:MoaA/NifB/PqqE/SkfB family radical SAM enzyme
MRAAASYTGGYMKQRFSRGINHLPDKFEFRSKEAAVFPEMVVCGIAFNCNARCIHCPNAATGFSASVKGPDQFMTWDIFKKIVAECALYPHSMVRMSSAGEVLLHPYATEMICYLLERKTDKNVALTTNGSLLSERKSLLLLESGIRSIEISVDAATKETYEKVRVGLTFENVLVNIKRLVELRNKGKYNTRVMVSIIEQDANRKELDFIYSFWRNIVDDVLVRKLLSFKGLIHREEGAWAPLLPKNTPCPFLWERVLIDSVGNLRGCVSDIYNTSYLGNIMKNSIADLWRSPLLTSWRRLHIEGKGEEVPMCNGCLDREYRSWTYNYFSALDKEQIG